MFDLEEEFKKLRSLCIKNVTDRVATGELTAQEGEQLTDLCYERMVQDDTDLYDGDEGWSSSQRCW